MVREELTIALSPYEGRMVRFSFGFPMPILSSAVGKSWSVRCDLSTRWALAYAAALEFPALPYLDDACAEGLLLPPSFCVCLEWQVAGSAVRDEILGNSPAERRRSVHALQDSIFHRPLRAGVTVEITARIARVARISAGTLVDIDISTRDIDTGALFVATRFAVIFRGVASDGERACASDHPAMPVPPAGEGALAAEQEQIAIPVAKGLPHIYSECARIWNPIHTERREALAAGLPDIILHGTATWSLAARELLRLEAPSGRIARLSARFRNPVLPGSDVRMSVSAAAEGLRGFRVLRPDGAVALDDGYALFL